MSDPIVAEPKTLGSFVNANGKAFAIEGISPLKIERMRLALLAQREREGKPLPDEPKPPTYEIENAAGEKFKLPHDATTIQTDEDKAAWAAYLSAKFRYEQALTEFGAAFDPLVQKVAYLCVQVDPDQDKDWTEELEFFGIPIPDKKVERRLLYVETKVISSTHDAERLLMQAMALSGMADERMVEAIENKFRAELDTAFRKAIPGEPEENTGEQPG